MTIPGTYAVVRTHDFIGWLIRVAQLLFVGGGWHWNHAVLIVGSNGEIVEATPSGVKAGSLAQYSDYRVSASQATGTATAWALSLVGRCGYNWLDYVAIALHRWHIRPAWVSRIVDSEARFICSQLVARAFEIDGRPLFTSVWAGDVTPGMLGQPAPMTRWSE